MPRHTVLFFKDGQRHGFSPEHKDLASAKNFAEDALLQNGADSYAIYQEGSSEAVYVRKPKNA